MKHPWFLLLCVLFSSPLYGQSSTEGLVLNGAAMHIENGRSLYVAGLYLDEQSSDPAKILSPDTNKIMQIVITTENRNNRRGWSKYSWKSYWQNHIAVNNPDAAYNEQSFKLIKTFTTLAKDSLVRGDEVKIIYRAGVTEVELNGESVAKNRGVEVFNQLLLVWIGDVPPSADFRENILGGASGDQWEANSNLLLNYKVPNARKALYSSWLENENGTDTQQQIADAKVKEAETEAKEAAARAKEAAAEQRRKTALEKSKKEREREELAKKKQRKSQTTSNSERVAQQAAEQNFYQDIIQWQIQRFVFNNVEYPHWARQFSNEGLVEITFQLNSNRELTFNDSNEDVELILFKEVERVVRESTEALIIPGGITGNRWSLSASYLFDLKGKVLPKPSPPTPPAHLKNKTISTEQKNALIKQYEDEVVKTIKANFIYPERAKMSKHKGEISANISITRWGEVANIEMVKETRFKYLNDAVISEIEKNAPYRILPLEVNTDLVVVQLNLSLR